MTRICFRRVRAIPLLVGGCLFLVPSMMAVAQAGAAGHEGPPVFTPPPPTPNDTLKSNEVSVLPKSFVSSEQVNTEGRNYHCFRITGKLN